MQTEAIAEALGSRKMLGKAVRRPDDLAQLVRKGLPAVSVTALAEKLHLRNGVLGKKLGIPQRTLTRRLSQTSRLTPAESDRTVRMARVYANAVEMIGGRENSTSECSDRRYRRQIDRSILPLPARKLLSSA